MTLYLGAHLSTAKGYFAMVEEALAMDANTFAFFTRNPRGGKAKALDTEDIQKAREALTEHGFGPLVAHAPYTLNPCAVKDNVREFAELAMREDLQRLEHLPGNYYNFHPGSHVGQGAEEAIPRIAEILNKVMWPEQETVVLLETMAGKGTEVGRSFEELKALLDLVDIPERIGVLLDTCHISDGGYDVIGDLDGVLDEFDRVIGLERLKALHLNDSKNPPGSRKDRHEKIGQGLLGEETFRNVIRNGRLNPLPMILETPNEFEGYKAEIALLRSFA